MKTDYLVAFSRWVPWSERKLLPAMGKPGVYLLGRFTEKAPSGTPQLLNNVIYIGETCGQTIDRRLYQFSRSAFEGAVGHSGGHHFRARFKTTKQPNWLYVSAMSPELGEPHVSAFIRHVERALLWDFVQLHDQYPKCNRK